MPFFSRWKLTLKRHIPQPETLGWNDSYDSQMANPLSLYWGYEGIHSQNMIALLFASNRTRYTRPRRLHQRRPVLPWVCPQSLRRSHSLSKLTQLILKLPRKEDNPSKLCIMEEDKGIAKARNQGIWAYERQYGKTIISHARPKTYSESYFFFPGCGKEKVFLVFRFFGDIYKKEYLEKGKHSS